jgi:hypothetical protein
MSNEKSYKTCRKCGSSNVTRERCLNCGETYPYTDVSISRGSVILYVVIIGGAILFVAIRSSLSSMSESGSSLPSDLDGSIIMGAIILILIILVRRGKKGKL